MSMRHEDISNLTKEKWINFEIKTKYSNTYVNLYIKFPKFLSNITPEKSVPQALLMTSIEEE